jgi:hypothetical protein
MFTTILGFLGRRQRRSGRRLIDLEEATLVKADRGESGTISLRQCEAKWDEPVKETGRRGRYPVRWAALNGGVSPTDRKCFCPAASRFATH